MNQHAFWKGSIKKASHRKHNKIQFMKSSKIGMHPPKKKYYIGKQTQVLKL